MAPRTVRILKSGRRLKRLDEQSMASSEIIGKDKSKLLDDGCIDTPTTTVNPATDPEQVDAEVQFITEVTARLKRCPNADLSTMTCSLGHCRRPFKDPLTLAFHLSYSHIDRSRPRTIGPDTTCLVCGKVCSSGHMLSLHAHMSHKELSIRHTEEMRALSRLVDCRAAANRERELNWKAKLSTKNFKNNFNQSFENDDDFYDVERSFNNSNEEDKPVEEDEVEDVACQTYENFTRPEKGITRIIDLPLIPFNEDEEDDDDQCPVIVTDYPGSPFNDDETHSLPVNIENGGGDDEKHYKNSVILLSSDSSSAPPVAETSSSADTADTDTVQLQGFSCTAVNVVFPPAYSADETEQQPHTTLHESSEKGGYDSVSNNSSRKRIFDQSSSTNYDVIADCFDESPPVIVQIHRIPSAPPQRKFIFIAPAVTEQELQERSESVTQTILDWDHVTIL